MASTDEGYQIPDELKVAGDTRWLNKSEWCQSVLVYLSGALTVSDATPTIVGYDTEDHDTNTLHDNVVNNSRLTCLIRGVYEISAFAVWQNSAVGHRIIRIKKNGGASIRDSVIMPVTTGITTYHLLTTIHRLAYGDYLEMEVEHTAGGNLDLQAGAANSFFAMHRIA